MKTKKLTTHIDEDILKDLKAFAKQTDRNISKVISEALKEYIGPQLPKIGPFSTRRRSDHINGSLEGSFLAS